MMTREQIRMPIAMIGASCIVGGAGTPAELWERMSNGKPSFTEVPEDRFPWRDYFSENPRGTDKGSVWRASFFDELELPWRELKIGPKMLDGLHRSDVYIIEAIRRAIVDAHLSERPYCRERTAVIMGGAEMGYDFRIIHPYMWHVKELVSAAEEALKAHESSEELRRRVAQHAEGKLNDLSARNFTRGAVSGMSIALGRACSLFDLKGPHYVVNSDGASMLAAMDHAIRGLILQDFDIAFVGSISAYLSPASFVTFDRLGLLTPEEHPRAFDANAKGTLLGEGVGFIVLRRLDDAIAAGDRIHSIIRGIGGANEGRRGALVSAPYDAQLLAAQRAYANAGYTPRDTQYLECHASGIDALDAAELKAMAKIFENHPGPRVTIASTKNVLGYLQAAAALPGLIRTISAMTHRTLPAQRHVHQPREELLNADCPFQLLSEPTQWPAPPNGFPRRASLNSIALGGQAYHLTIEEYVPEYHEQLVNNAKQTVERCPIAVVAYGTLTPGAKGSTAFFDGLVSKSDRLIRVPRERFDIDRHYHPDRTMGTYCTLGGFVTGFQFDALSFRIPPKVVEQLDRTHLYALTVAQEAMERVNVDDAIRTRTAVFMADMPGRTRERDLELRIVYATMAKALESVLRDEGVAAGMLQDVLDDTEQRFKRGTSPITPHSLVGAGSSAQAALIAHAHSLQGPTAVFESTCASSLASIGAGAAALQLGDIDMALAGGAFADLSAELYTLNCTFQGLSATGSRPFDADASGFIPGEGAGIVVLKRLADAERDGDEIMGVIAGIGASSDGKGKSLLAPNPVGQELAVHRALQNADIEPADIQYLACHGTATPVGDYTEVLTYANVMRELPPQSLPIASVKSMIGHLHSAAGVVNVVAVLEGLRRHIQPPQINCDRPNPDIAWQTIPAFVLTEPRAWPLPQRRSPRRAGVSAFGMGGTNYHVIIEEYQSRKNEHPAHRPNRPMLHTIEHQSPDLVIAHCDLTPDEHRYLAQHLLEGIPVLPGAFAMELMAEAALVLFPDGRLVAMQDVRFLQAIKVFPGKNTRLVVTARAAGRAAQVQIELQPHGLHASMRRKLATATVLIDQMSPAPSTPRIDSDRAKSLFAPENHDLSAFYERIRDVLYCGPLLRGLRQIRFSPGARTAGWIQQVSLDQLFSSTKNPTLPTSPLALDSAFQAAGLTAYAHHERVALPAGTKQIRFYRQLPVGRNIFILNSYRGLTEEGLAMVDVVAFDPETHAIYFEMDAALFSLGNPMDISLKSLIEGLPSP